MTAISLADSKNEQREHSDCRAGEERHYDHGVERGEHRITSFSLLFVDTKLGSGEAGTNNTM
jgi:hypothetical protein